MPLFVDVHNIDGPVSIEQAAAAHAADLQTQPEFGVNYLRYWVDVSHGKIFCPVDAPDADTAHTVHRKAHGLASNDATRSWGAPTWADLGCCTVRRRPRRVTRGSRYGYLSDRAAGSGKQQAEWQAAADGTWPDCGACPYDPVRSTDRTA
jgi:hypothetical protein